MTEDEKTAARQEIDALRSSFMRALREVDLPALGALLHVDAKMVPPASADWVAMLAAAGEAPFPPGYELEITPIELVIANEEWAFEFGNSVASYHPPDSDERVRMRDTYLMVFRNEGDGWKPYREVASGSPPPGGWTNL